MTAKAPGSSGTSPSVNIVVYPGKPDYGPHPVQSTVRSVCGAPQLHEPVPVHNSDQRYSFSTENRNVLFAVDSNWRSVSLSTSDPIEVEVPSLLRRPKIRRTGVYDDLHTMVSWSNTI